MSNSKSAVPAPVAAVVPAVVPALVISQEAAAEIFIRTTKWVKAADSADKAAIGLLDTLMAAQVKPEHLRAETGEVEFMRGMSQAVVLAFPEKAQALLQYTDKLPSGDWDVNKPYQYNNATKRTWQMRIGSRLGDIRNGLVTRYAKAEIEAAKAAEAAEAAKAAEALAKANAEAEKAAEAEAKAKAAAAKAEAKASVAKASNKAALAAEAAKAAEALELATAAKTVEAAKAVEAKALEDKLKAEAVARAEAQVATGLRDSLVAIWTKQVEQVRKASNPIFDAPKVIKALDALIAEVMVVRK